MPSSWPHLALDRPTAAPRRTSRFLQRLRTALAASVALVVLAVPAASAERIPPDPNASAAWYARESLVDAGIASTYGTGDGFQGNTTACGQRFDTFVPQVAHKSLPCGTILRVEDADSGKSVIVEVTDRGPYIRGRVVDLSWAAFRQLDPTGPGLLNVRVYQAG